MKDAAILIIEFVAESSILIDIILFSICQQKKWRIDRGLALIGAAIICVLFSDSIYNINIMMGCTKLVLINQFFYSGFLFFMLAFLVRNLNLSQRRFNEWAWFFLLGFIVYGYISYKFIVSPYLHSGITMIWKIDSALYSLLSVTIFALILPFAIRVQDRRTFWLLNLVLLLLISDFAIRYYYNFVSTSVFSWPELGWCVFFVGLAWLIRDFCRNKKAFFTQSLILAPIISVRVLLAFSICGANVLFLIGILSIKVHAIQNALDIANVLLLLFVFWTIAVYSGPIRTPIPATSEH
jgi:hypothetical protein